MYLQLQKRQSVAPAAVASFVQSDDTSKMTVSFQSVSKGKAILLLLGWFLVSASSEDLSSLVDTATEGQFSVGGCGFDLQVSDD